MPRGAAYYNGYYPGLIRVVPNAAFWVVLDDGEVMLNVVRHVRPVVATDFSNTFRRRAEGGRVFLDHPIRDVPEDSVAANFRLHSGETDWAIYTKEHDYLFYRRHPFTEITVGVEVEDVERLPAGLGGFFDPAIRRLVELYRAATRDVVIRVDSRVQVVREQVVRYREPARETAFERLVDHVPRRYDRPMVLAVQETVHDTPVVTRTPEEIAQVLGHHLASNTQVSDAQRALIDAFERLVVAQDPRFSLVEVLSVVEVVAMDFVNAVRRGQVPPGASGAGGRRDGRDPWPQHRPRRTRRHAAPARAGLAGAGPGGAGGCAAAGLRHRVVLARAWSVTATQGAARDAKSSGGLGHSARSIATATGC
jgi:hypothetical protein